MAAGLSVEVGLYKSNGIMAQASSNMLPGLLELGVKGKGLDQGVLKGVLVPCDKDLLYAIIYLGVEEPSSSELGPRPRLNAD